MKYKRGIVWAVVWMLVFTMNGTSLTYAGEQQYTETSDAYTQLQTDFAYERKAEPYVPLSLTDPYAPESVAAAVLGEITVDYDLEKEVLIVEWAGTGIGYVDVYQDNVLIAAKAEGERLALGTKLDALSKHTYRVVPYNQNGAAGKEMSYVLEVGNYVARLENVVVEYSQELKQIQIRWESVNTQYVTVSMNYEAIVEKYRENSCVLNYPLQPGASYVVTIEPYNSRNEEGEIVNETLEVGSFEAPEEPAVSIGSVPIKDADGNYTGFSRPAINVEWEAEAQAVYEVYRAEKNKMSAYNWLATVSAGQDGIYTYVDEKVGIGAYYYKVRRKIVEDDYIQQDVLTALSEAGSATVSVPKPKVKAKLNKGGEILVTMESGREYISGYEIYRKSGKGKFKKIATVTEDEYVDKDVEFGLTYRYKVKAYYYDMGSGKKNLGKFSKVSKVKNTIGDTQIQAMAVSADTVKLKWTPAVNAAEYEVYYKTGTPGDSYVLWTTTSKLSMKRKLHKSGTYYFMVKAYQTTGRGKTYFSGAEASCKMGYSAPKGVEIKKTSYRQDPLTLAIMQEDTLSWNRVYGAKGYYVELYNPLTQKYNNIATIKKGSKTSYTVSNQVMSAPVVLKYRISAYGGGSVKRGDTIDIIPKLGSSQKVKAVKSGSNVKVIWRGVAGAECYRVYRSNGRTRILVGETTNLSLVDKGLSVGAVYQYYVQAVSITQNLVGQDSLPVSCRIEAGKISKLTAVNTVSGNVQLAWEAMKNAEAYIIYYRVSEDEEYQKLAEVSGKNTSYIHQNQALDSTCYYKVTAVQTNSGGVLVESAAASAKVKITK